MSKFLKGHKINVGRKKPLQSIRMKGNDYGKGNKGKPKSKITKLKMSISQKGKKVSDETKKKISIANKGRLIGDKNPAKRPEVRKKISEALMGHKGAFAGKKRPEHSKKMKGRKQNREHIKRRFKNNKDTLIERIIEKKLKELNLIYSKQEIICGFCVDFYLPKYNLVIECDGDYWHNRPRAKEKDNNKNLIWEKNMINILRLKEFEIIKNIELCTRRILLMIQNG